MTPLDMNFHTITPLEEQVVRKGRCPKCHTKSLCDLSVTGIDADQCSECLTVFVLEKENDLA